MTATKQPLFLNVTDLDLHLTPAQFDRLCVNNPHLNLELTAGGEIVIMPLATIDRNKEKFNSIKTPLTDDNSIESKKSLLSALTAEEVAQKTRTIERFMERKRQLWESLTPEEKAEHDRQFENLLQQIEEARK